jgi:serine/threonine protein kinase
MREYGLPSDIWAMGVIGFQLSYGRHPWRFSMDPYRPGPTFMSLRPAFNREYEKVMGLLGERSHVASGQLDCE